MATLITNIHSLVNTRESAHMLKGAELAELPVINNAYLLIEDDIIAGYGNMDSLPELLLKIPADDVFNADGRFVLPAWCDSHTHIVYAGSRETEFVDKIKGLGYAEIAERGGGILNSARKLQETSEDALFSQAWKRLEEVSKLGTGAIEIKSGYGLTVESDLRMFPVFKKLRGRSNLIFIARFLGPHSYPRVDNYNHLGCIVMDINEMLTIFAQENLADYIVVFCEK